MNKNNNFSLKLLTIVLPFVGFIFTLVMVIYALAFNQPKYNLKANLTDGHFKTDGKLAYFNNHPISSLNQPLPELNLREQKVLADTAEEKWIEVDLTKQHLYAHEGNKIVYEFPISSGKWALTPTGEFRIWAKFKYTLMHGGSQANNTYYYLPNVPFTQYFYQGYGIHGTYWHNNFGHPMSHGCVNMYTPDAQALFYWTNPSLPADSWSVYSSQDSPGTRVVIHGVTPKS